MIQVDKCKSCEFKIIIYTLLKYLSYKELDRFSINSQPLLLLLLNL